MCMRNKVGEGTETKVHDWSAISFPGREVVGIRGEAEYKWETFYASNENISYFMFLYFLGKLWVTGSKRRKVVKYSMIWSWAWWRRRLRWPECFVFSGETWGRKPRISFIVIVIVSVIVIVLEITLKVMGGWRLGVSITTSMEASTAKWHHMIILLQFH